MAVIQVARAANQQQTLPIDLQGWTSFRTLRDEAKICIRPLRPDDRDHEVEFIRCLSEQTRYFRMMSPLRFLSKHLLDQLMTIDYSQSMAFAATVGEAEGERFVGLGRYGKTDEPDAVEFAVTVADEWQRRGVGRELVDQLARYAIAQRYRRMIGWVLYENHCMLALARACGFKVRIAPAQGVLEIVRSLV